MQAIQPPALADGEIYVGLIGDAAGKAYHLVLLPGDSEDATTSAQPEQKCAQCQKPYKHGTNKAGCPKCAPGVRIAEVEFQKPLHASQEQADCEPFGYFRPEAFGWTDCAKTDDGAIALYEHPAEVEQLKNELRLSDDMLKAVAVLCQKYERWLEFLHSPNKDSEGFEWGIARVKFDGDKTIALWTNQDHSDLDAAIDAAQAERAREAELAEPRDEAQQPQAQVMLNGLTEAETDQSASVAGVGDA